MTQSQWVYRQRARTIKFNYLAHSFQVQYLRDVLLFSMYWREVCMWKGAGQFFSLCTQFAADVNWILQHCVVRFNQSLSKSFFSLSEQRARFLFRKTCMCWRRELLLEINCFTFGPFHIAWINWIRAPCLVININFQTCMNALISSSMKICAERKVVWYTGIIYLNCS